MLLPCALLGITAVLFKVGGNIFISMKLIVERRLQTYSFVPRAMRYCVLALRIIKIQCSCVILICYIFYFLGYIIWDPLLVMARWQDVWWYNGWQWRRWDVRISDACTVMFSFWFNRFARDWVEKKNSLLVETLVGADDVYYQVSMSSLFFDLTGRYQIQNRIPRYLHIYYIFFEIYQFLFTWYGCGFGVWYELLILFPVILAFLSRAPSVRFSHHVRSNHASQIIWNSCIVYNGVHGCFTAGKLFKRKFFVRTLFKRWVKKFNIWWCSDFKPLLLVFQFRWQ